MIESTIQEIVKTALNKTPEKINQKETGIRSMLSEELSSLEQKLDKEETEEKKQTRSHRMKKKAVHLAKALITADKDPSILDIDETTSITLMIHHVIRAAENYGATIPESKSNYFQNKLEQGKKLEKDISDNFTARYTLHEAQGGAETGYSSFDNSLKFLWQLLGTSALLNTGIGIAAGLAFKIGEKAHKAHLEKTGESLQARKEIANAELLRDMKEVYLNIVKDIAEKQKIRITEETTVDINNKLKAIDVELIDAEQSIEQAKTHKELINAYNKSIELLENFHQKPSICADTAPGELYRLNNIKLTLQEEIEKDIAEIAELKQNADEYNELCKKLEIPFATTEWIREDQLNMRLNREHAREFKHSKDLEKVASSTTTSTPVNELREKQHKAAETAEQLEAKLGHFRELRKKKKQPISDEDWRTLLNRAALSDTSRLNNLKEKAQRFAIKVNAIEASIQFVTKALEQMPENKESNINNRQKILSAHPQVQLLSASAITPANESKKEEEIPRLIRELRITPKHAKQIILLQKNLLAQKEIRETSQTEKHKAEKEECENSKLPSIIIRATQNRYVRHWKTPKQPSEIFRKQQIEAEKSIIATKKELHKYRGQYAQNTHQKKWWNKLIATITSEQQKPMPALEQVKATEKQKTEEVSALSFSLSTNLSSSLSSSSSDRSETLAATRIHNSYNRLATTLVTIKDGGFNPLVPEELDNLESPMKSQRNPLFINRTPQKKRETPDATPESTPRKQGKEALYGQVSSSRTTFGTPGRRENRASSDATGEEKALRIHTPKTTPQKQTPHTTPEKERRISNDAPREEKALYTDSSIPQSVINFFGSPKKSPKKAQPEGSPSKQTQGSPLKIHGSPKKPQENRENSHKTPSRAIVQRALVYG